MFTATRSSYQRAIDKGTALGTCKTISQLDATTYRVPGLMAVYTVTVAPDGEQACTCAAGQAAMPCYHSAAVWLRRIAQRANVETFQHPTRETPAQVRERLRSESRASVARWNEDDLDGAPSLYAAAV